MIPVILLVLTGIAVPEAARAVPPPDFLFAASSQLIQALSVALLFVTAAVASMRSFIGLQLARLSHPRVIGAVGILLLAGAAVGGAVAYDRWQQGRQVSEFTQEVDMLAEAPPTEDLDALAARPLPAASVIAAPSPAADAGEAFIRRYYADIGSGRLQEAYAVSKQSVPFATFASWYAATTGVDVTDLTNIDFSNYSLRLTLHEGAAATQYAVLMRIAPDGSGGYRVAESQSRAIAVTQAEGATPTGNEELAALIGTGVFILDAREDEEFALGSIPGSTHIRFADLVAGRWIELPTDRDIHVVCWSGIRGKEVADFLRSKGIRARYLIKGVTGWTEYGGTFVGETAFSSRYGAARYKQVFSTEQMRALIAQGTAIVDSRPPQTFAAGHILGSINIPIIYTPTSVMDSVLAQVPPGAQVVTVCDDWVSCFDAKVTGIKLEGKGHEFLGRFSRPDELR